ncbi:hypothetical protein [Saliphagus infecundisoli]|uniref:Uncharacterized protein n=1 Tax=Saliphagus infecundisoli TaxID=1849069 RepID=A0ABD5QHX2_9EURY|nr:hypothetical protein [Saliphagus infecundisoli]
MVDAVKTVIQQTFDDARVVTIEQDNWYPDLQLRTDTLIPYENDAMIEVKTEAEATHTETVGDETFYHKRVPDVIPCLDGTLTEAGFAAEPYRHDYAGIRVLGWERNLRWFQPGDYLKLYKWRTPIEVTHVCLPDDRPPRDFPLPVTPNGDYIGSASLHLGLSGQRGGEYLLDYQDETAALYERDSSDDTVLVKTTEPSRVIFVGNPETGPRLNDTSTDPAH